MSIEISHLSRRFGDFAALDDVSLSLARGEFVALLGPSGSGKTTLLRLLAGLDFPDLGLLLQDGRDLARIPARERGVGLVFQHYALFRHMTVAENIAFGLRVRPRAHRPDRAEIAARVERLLQRVQLEGLGRRYPAQLSGGQRQRVALARALAIEPQLLLLDEPFGALDAQVRLALRRWLRHLHEELGLTTVFVTHDQEEALELADRVVVMNRGRIEQVGTADEVYDAPNSPFVYGFIGESSTLPVRIEDGQLWVQDRTIGLRAEDAPAGDGTLHFRPHDVELLDGCGGCIAGVVVGSRRVAGSRRVELEVGSAGNRVEIDLPADHRAAERSRIAFRPRRWKLFGEGGEPLPHAGHAARPKAMAGAN